MYQSIISYRRARYLWVALLLSGASVAAYWWHEPINSPNGGTWLGYTLGTIAALLIVWLMWLGIRKRSYRSRMGSVQDWTSAHVYLGTALLLVATLHSGIQFGVNIHTLAYVLMVLVIVSGFFGIHAYIKYPSLMTENRSGDSLQSLLEQIEKIEETCRREAITPPLNELVENAIRGTQLGGSGWQQLTAVDHSSLVVPTSIDPSSDGKAISNRNQDNVIRLLANQLSETVGGREAGAVQNLLAGFAARQTLLSRVRRDVQIRARMKIWLYAHVPLSFGLLAALIVHIVVVFFYW